MVVAIYVCQVCGHHNRVPYRKTEKRRPRREEMLYEFVTKALTLLQEPKSKYDLTVALFTSHYVAQSFLDKHLKLGNIEQVPYNPNKYILKIRGKRVLYLLKELNKMFPKWESNIIIPLDKVGRKKNQCLV